MTIEVDTPRREADRRVWSEYDAVLFDLDGVIMRTATVHAAAWKHLFDDFLAARARATGRPFEPFDIDSDYRLYVDGRRRYDGVTAFLASRGLQLDYGAPDDPPGAPTCCGLGNRKNRYFLAELAARGVEVFPDAMELLDALRGAEKRLAVVSASENCSALLERVGLLDRFQVRVTGVEAAQWGLAGKPAPDTFLKAAALLGVEPRDAVVVEDSIAGIQAGRAGGFGLVVGVDRRGEPDSLSESGADIVLHDLTDLMRMNPARSNGVARRARDDVRFEGILLCPPDGDARRAVLADPALAEALEELRGLGSDVEVAGDDPVADVERLVERLGVRGIGSGLVLVLGWLSAFDLPASAARTSVVSVLEEQPDQPEGMRWIGGGSASCLGVLNEQADRRVSGRVPSIDDDPAWTITVWGAPTASRRAHQALLTVADTRFGTRGVREEEGLGTVPRVLAAGVFDEATEPPSLLEGPGWTGLHLLRPLDHSRDRRTLDMRTGVLYREQVAAPVPLRSMRFASLSRPGSFALRAEGAVEWLHAGPAILPPATDGTFVRRQRGDRSAAVVRSERGGAIAAVTAQQERSAGGRRVVERLVCYAADPEGRSREHDAVAELASVEQIGFEGLLAEHRAAWAGRWEDALVCIDGDADLERAVRFNLFHLMASVATEGEAVIGPRGLAGPGYRGHVFWDTDVFMLPFFAATAPAAARAMLEYRVRRLEPARRAAAGNGRRGARFPWESARTGVDVTPVEDVMPIGPPIPIMTGQHEEHIVADVAWAAMEYVAWSGDDDFLRGPGRELVLDTARYWASRVRVDERGGHIDRVIGPDEYHELVDDNAFTNVMARWNLRRAVELAEEGTDVPAEEVAKWRRVADVLVDNYDPASGLYEQFAGYNGLEPLVISDLAETPVAADLLFGRPRISASQVIKQPDVLMLHHLVPEETAEGSLRPNLEFYDPRCAHGSSLAPAIHASLFARDGRPDQALRLFRMACRLDLDNLTGATAGGLHMATFGGVWQALVHGFAGIRPQRSGLTVDPQIPNAWNELRVRLRHRGRRLEVRASPDALHIRSDGPARVTVPGSGTAEVGDPGLRWRREPGGWALE
ncbi:MAG: beta-phosphoglucomutase family hydrolase [Candidatus Nanopelagicales bacterium]